MTHAYIPDQMPEAPAVIENITFDELCIGQSAQRRRALTQDDIEAFAAVSGDTNPAHLDPAYADGTPFHGVIAHGMWAGALISAVLGTQLPGPGTIYLEQNLRFVRPVHVGDALTVTVTVLSKEPEKKRVELDCTVSNQHGDTVVFGVALVLAPTLKVRRPGATVPRLLLEEAAGRLEG
ncbi:MaoC/PaaZ C-terminal domain-containing protein [Ottowia sp.]|uniref:MaoC/PaaZ C-terminal domain-containing protein n=1 Tax=Ottowia sp. TaxID=1898956 RepID=UPI002639FC70|nr:MaoC/PaaZ C-terminal domain-containing protein [Ottowia sp.]